MPWYGWTLVVVMSASALTTIGMVGKPRTPTEPSTAVVVVVVDALMIWVILALGGVV